MGHIRNRWLASSAILLSVGCGSPTVPGFDRGGAPDAGATEGGVPHEAVTDGGGVIDASTTHDAPSTPEANPAEGGGGPTSLAKGQSTIALTVAGHARTAILYVPESATSMSELAIALHGNGDTDSNFLATSGLEPLADADGTVLIVPQGIPRNVVVELGGGETQTVPDVDWDAYNSTADGNIDLPFLDQLREQIVATGQVDPHHVFVFGYSQGGYLSFEYGMVTSTALSCSAVLAASSPFGGGSGDPLIAGAMRKIPVVLQIGTEDSAYPAAETTESALVTDGFPTELEAIAGAGHVPIPGKVSVPWDYCRGETL